MKKIKITFAIATLLCALGTTYAANQKAAETNNCSTEISGFTVNYDRANCDHTDNICCYDVTAQPLALGERTL
ncbi:hypothetical protein HDC92_004980 [Pedobacter sp. AK017]|uniref:DUF6520 family protein n=1 Tax=Pedobacter sp. AK017 TaxID=2723073 RepID=UPI001616C1DB|nr:DUF6520 family protein [Pedobacter sp. AK017]MBB5441273.1 hypothetical protein [Pedobacter sp. AK017]